MTLLTRENYVGARVVRAFARQDDEIADFTAVNDKLKTFQLTAGRISALMTPLTYLIVNLGVIAILMRGGLQVNSGALTQGEIIALINYMNQILINLLRIADLVVSVTRALASGIRVSEILNTKSTMTDPAAAALAPVAGAPAVAFDHVALPTRCRCPQPDRHQLCRPERSDHRRDRRHGQRQIHPDQPDSPLL